MLRFQRRRVEHADFAGTERRDVKLATVTTDHHFQRRRQAVILDRRIEARIVCASTSQLMCLLRWREATVMPEITEMRVSASRTLSLVEPPTTPGPSKRTLLMASVLEIYQLARARRLVAMLNKRGADV